MNPIVSIIIPVYNAEGTLPRCVDSILNQTFTDFELLLVDDGSADARQLVGAHVGQHARHVPELVGILVLVPGIGPGGKELIIVLSFVVSGVEKVLKIVEAHAIEAELLLRREGAHAQKRAEEGEEASFGHNKRVNVNSHTQSYGLFTIKQIYRLIFHVMAHTMS